MNASGVLRNASRPRSGKAAIVFALTLGVLAGVGTLTFGYGKGASYLSNNPQTCVNCHDASPAVVAKDFDMDAVMAGFKAVSRKTYEEVHAEIEKTADGIDVATGDQHMGGAHPVSCLDCHDPDTMEFRILRPGFILGIDKLAKSDDPVTTRCRTCPASASGERPAPGRLRSEHHDDAARDASVRVLPMSRRVLLCQQDDADVPVGKPARRFTKPNTASLNFGAKASTHAPASVAVIATCRTRRRGQPRSAVTGYAAR